jgi:beta-glucuronosyltransferase
MPMKSPFHRGSSFPSSARLLDRKWILPVSLLLTLPLLLLLLLFYSLSPLPLYLYLPSFGSSSPSSSLFIESKIRIAAPSSLSSIPRLAYLISGSLGDGPMLQRTLLALYHPTNSYIVHLDRESPQEERDALKAFVENHQLFKQIGNVRMITKANLITYRGPTMVANTLHAAAMLLWEGGNWDWFINLSASDYPLVTQDGTWCFLLWIVLIRLIILE